MRTLQSKLTRTATRTQGLAGRWRAVLTADDQAELGTAFWRAESLAHAALEQAIEQIGGAYEAELREQLADEARHVGVFAAWHEAAPPPLRLPKPRQRPEAMWFATLLANEIAGFCQFHMLAGLLGDPARRAEVLEVAADEVLHIERLLRWLAPLRGKAAWVTVSDMVRAFVERLPGRMRQFLPRDELAGLRAEMADITAELLQDVWAS